MKISISSPFSFENFEASSIIIQNYNDEIEILDNHENIFYALNDSKIFFDKDKKIIEIKYGIVILNNNSVEILH